MLITWVTFITLLLAPGHNPITLSESYWDHDACLNRLPDMYVLMGTMWDASGAELLDGDACATVTWDDPNAQPDAETPMVGTDPRR